VRRRPVQGVARRLSLQSGGGDERSGVDRGRIRRDGVGYGRLERLALCLREVPVGDEGKTWVGARIDGSLECHGPADRAGLRTEAPREGVADEAAR